MNQPKRIYQVFTEWVDMQGAVIQWPACGAPGRVCCFTPPAKPE